MSIQWLGYGMDDREISVRFPAGAKECFLLHSTQTDPPCLLSVGYLPRVWRSVRSVRLIIWCWGWECAGLFLRLLVCFRGLHGKNCTRDANISEELLVSIIQGNVLEYPEGGGRKLLWNVSNFIPIWTASCSRSVVCLISEVCLFYVLSSFFLKLFNSVNWLSLETRGHGTRVMFCH